MIVRRVGGALAEDGLSRIAINAASLALLRRLGEHRKLGPGRKEIGGGRAGGAGGFLHHLLHAAGVSQSKKAGGVVCVDALG